jgi:hypothetical protein
MTTIDETPLARLENDQRLLNGTVKDPGTQPGSFLFRGEIAIQRSPESELKADQVMLYASAGKTELPFYACALQSFESLKPMTDLLGDMLGASGKYFAFCSNLKYRSKYRVKMGEATFYVLPLEDNTAFNDLLELLGVDRGSIKRLSVRDKLESIRDKLAAFGPSYEQISYERGLEVMTPA